MSEDRNKDGDRDFSPGIGPISRREFALGSVAILGASAGSDASSHGILQTDSRTAVNTAPTGPAFPQPPVSGFARHIKLTVNKWKYELEVEPEWSLRELLRDKLGFLSVKDMCNGHGACGSCTVIADSRPVLSCLTLAIECDGMAIETAEGISGVKPGLIEAYVMNHCMQCGYCTPGFIVTAKALLDRIEKPTENDIREALGGNICRCGTYPQHIVAVLEAAANTA